MIDSVMSMPMKTAQPSESHPIVCHMNAYPPKNASGIRAERLYPTAGRRTSETSQARYYIWVEFSSSLAGR